MNSDSNNDSPEPRIDMLKCDGCGALLIGARTKHERLPIEPDPCDEGTVALRISTTAPPFAIKLEDDEEFLLARATDEPLFSPHRCKSRPDSQASTPNGSTRPKHHDPTSTSLPPVQSPLGPMPPP